MGIVVIGDVFIDIKGFSTSPYIPYGRNAGTIAQIHGGVGRNVAEDIANVELEPTFVSSVDDDAMGEDVIRKLDRHKVNTKYMKKVKNGMGTWLAVFDHEGEVGASISKRPDHKPIEQILDEHGDEIFKDADSIVIEIDIDREIVKKTFHYAEKYKKKVYAIVSNMTIAIERRDFIRRTECFVCNQQEAGILFSEDYEEMSAEELSKVLSERIQSAKIPKMVVTMGGEGAVYADQNGESGVYPALKVDVVDTTGAGDRYKTCIHSYLYIRKYLSKIYAGRIRYYEINAMESIIIGIAGGSGSGKSTFTNRVKKYFGDDITVIYHDNYYHRQDGIPYEKRVTVNYDHPDSLETDLLVKHLK